MSFPRAKLQRFNEVAACSPSPATYSPAVVKQPSSLRASFRKKLQKLTQSNKHSPPPSEIAPSVISINSTPCFRTPSSIPKKSKMMGFMKKSKPVGLFKQDEEALKEKIVECHNKDESIRELTEQLEELKLELAQRTAEEKLSKEKPSLEELESLKKELESAGEKLKQLEEENTNYKQEFEQCKTEMTVLKEEHIISLHALTVKHTCELEKLLRKIHELNIELKAVKNEQSSIAEQNEQDLQLVMDNMSLLERYYNRTVEEFNTNLESKNLAITNLNNTLRSLEEKLEETNGKLEEKSQLLVEKDLEMFEELRKKDEEIRGLKDLNKAYQNEETDDQVKTLITTIDALQKELECERQKTALLSSQVKDSDAKLKQVEEDLRETNMLSEMTWQDKFKQREEESAAILKECQAISEYNIIQTELEKNQIRMEFVQTKEDLERITSELNCLIKQNEELQISNEDLNKRLISVEDKKRSYDISLTKSLSTIETLTKRLLHSDNDVESLKKELEMSEAIRLEAEARCNHLMEEIEFLEKLNEDLEIQHENTITLMHDHIHVLQESLCGQLDVFKKQANVEISELKLRLEEKEKTMVAVMDHLHTQQSVNCSAQTVISSANNELERLEEFATDFKFKNNRLETTINKLNMELESSQELIKELEQTIGALEDELVQKSEDYDDVLKRVDHLQDKYDSYYNYCEYYKNKTVEYEKEIEEMAAINKKYIETCGKYDQLLQDHQHLTELNEELERKVIELLEEKEYGINNEELLVKNMELEEQLKSHKKIIEKLRKDTNTNLTPKKLKFNPSCDKENINSPNRSLNVSFIENNPGPLRERN